MRISRGFLVESLTVASWIIIMDFLVAITLLFIVGAYNIFFWVSTFMFFEFGMLLIVGSCFLSRQPLKDSKRFNENGDATFSWRLALIGKKLLCASIFLLVLSLIIYMFGYLF